MHQRGELPEPSNHLGKALHLRMSGLDVVLNCYILRGAGRASVVFSRVNYLSSLQGFYRGSTISLCSRRVPFLL